MLEHNTRSVLYLPPMLKIHRTSINLEAVKGVFIADEDKPENNDKIHLLYKFSGRRTFIQFEERLKLHEQFVCSYDPDKTSVMFVFNVPVEFQKDLELFKQSKFSMFSQGYKDAIIKFWGKENIPTVVGVLNKEEKVYREWENKINKDLPSSQWVSIPREQEAGSLIDFDKEVFKRKMKVESRSALELAQNSI